MSRRVVSGLLFLLCVPIPVHAQLTKAGAEFQVSTHTAGGTFSAVAMDSAGSFVVVWTSDHDGSSFGVFGQQFDSSGIKLGSEFQVNTYTTSTQAYAAVAVATGGEFVVVWQSYGSSQTDGFGFAVLGQRYDATGAQASIIRGIK